MTVDAIILTGPTASGKSAKALEMAQDQGGEIINADSMQLYEHLPILTACPSAEEKDQVPHHLYEILGDQEISSASWWVSQAEEKIREVKARGRLPILVGGTGMYIQALMEGLSPIPDIPEDIRRQARILSQGEDFYEYVCGQDPLIADRLKPGDGQRLARALEVFLVTGRSIVEWQEQPRQPSSFTFEYLTLIPSRDLVYDRINQRFVHMIEMGAIEEVQAMNQRPVCADSPILRAVGVKEIQGYLRGDLTFDEMISQGQQATRNYAKRQYTWLRNSGCVSS